MGPDGRGHDARRAKGRIQAPIRVVAGQGKECLTTDLGRPSYNQLPIRLNGQGIDLIILT